MRRLACAFQALILTFLALMQGTELCFCSLDEDDPCEECAHGLSAVAHPPCVHVEAAECDHLKFELPDVESVDSEIAAPSLVHIALPRQDEQNVTASCIAYGQPHATSPPVMGGDFVDYSVRALLRS